MKHNLPPIVFRRGMTLIELLVVIAILAILIALLVPGLNKAKEVAEAVKNTSNLKQIAMATINWAADNGSRLPSPQYPGGMSPPSGVSPEDYFPVNYNLGTSGLWLDGVVFAEIYLKENKDGEKTSYQVDEDGEHLKGTIFESTQSVKKDPMEKNWHKHSYAMNANLAYDRIYDQVESPDPYLTEKTLSNLLFAPNAMLYIECTEPNVVMFEDRQAIIDTIESRWDGSKAIVAYLDGHADRLPEREIPDMDIESDIRSSRFWRGVDAKR
ncbi:MAG: prepilin-type N-terminal cleavage/methylation domain-containing protein [Verrucomicrobiales bacterium]|jgi:prepilin-type N-terminal cleavage/methylation domain-containing protein|nr:prepilin-type N-terminal cleavage/methylation domain-containing protein [Verrucomicrobiales bacterium]MBP9222660.1 prepilin-type N-terminal cleavage/methylation domain-containing protein [Verrucomicrobiales bacterium]HQZ29267.1 prepilin-type N-terminal cleavage/methylation domain-containing protein [Verrucomicrobiales bacterium]